MEERREAEQRERLAESTPVRVLDARRDDPEADEDPRMPVRETPVETGQLHRVEGVGYASVSTMGGGVSRSITPEVHGNALRMKTSDLATASSVSRRS